MKIAAFTVAVLVAVATSAPAFATCQSCPEGYRYNHAEGVCVPKTVSS